LCNVTICVTLWSLCSCCVHSLVWNVLYFYIVAQIGSPTLDPLHRIVVWSCSEGSICHLCILPLISSFVLYLIVYVGVEDVFGTFFCITYWFSKSPWKPWLCVSEVCFFSHMYINCSSEQAKFKNGIWTSYAKVIWGQSTIGKFSKLVT